MSESPDVLAPLAVNSTEDYFFYAETKRNPQVGVCYGAGQDQVVAREEAARSALNYLRVITTN